MTCVNLKPNWNLLDSNFESYKLSFEQLPIYSVKLDTGPDVVSSKAEDFSYQRTKLLAMNNYLIADPWNDRTCYYIDLKGLLRKICITIETSIQIPSSVFKVDFNSSAKILPVSMSFPSSDKCLIVDDVGHCCLINTDDRTSTANAKWKTIFECNLIEDESCRVIILQSRQRCHDSTNIIDMAVLKFHERESATLVYIEWVTIAKTGEKWSLGKRWVFKVSNVPFFVGFGKQSNTIHFGSQSKISIIPNWEAELTQNDIEIADNCDQTIYIYNWKQSDDDITISIPLVEGIAKEDILCKFMTKHVEIGAQNKGNIKYFLNGNIFNEIDPGLCHWTISENILEVSLQKNTEVRRWEYVIEGDADREVIDDVTMTEVRGFQPTGLDGYEDCDDLPDSSSVLYCFGENPEKFTHESSLASNQWLFNCYHEQQHCIVLRHDVDALMWTCDASQGNVECPWSHIATFNALGYVKASKQDVKYANCASNASYAALCESTRRIFVYHTCTAASAPLRNRLTGKQAHLSKQQVVTLPSNAPIYGFHTANDMMFVLTAEELYVVKMYVPQS